MVAYCDEYQLVLRDCKRKALSLCTVHVCESSHSSKEMALICPFPALARYTRSTFASFPKSCNDLSYPKNQAAANPRIAGAEDQ